MYNIERSKQFKKDLKLLQKRGYPLENIRNVICKLQHGQHLPIKYRDHHLSGNWSNYRECHIAPDWLLIYRIQHHHLELIRTGTHSDLF